MTHRTIAIGDIHGCSTALKALLEAIQPGPEDEIITLGDYIDRGPDSCGVIEQLLALAHRCNLIPIMGNHEEMFFGAMDSRSGFDFWMRFGGDQMLESYGENAQISDIPRRHIAFLRSCRAFHETDAHIFVHANYWPNRPMDQQSTQTLFWDKDRARIGRHYSGKTAVVGHTPQESGEILDLGFLKCIDTNCCDGGWLSALDVNTGRYWQANQAGEVRGGQLDDSSKVQCETASR
jgi:serine/threonine protein phosphatase 1